jgi:Phosphotransferase enzyme family
VSGDSWRSRVRGVLSDGAGRVLVLDSGALPEVEVDGYAEDALEDALEEVRAGFEAQLGTRVAILRYVTRAVDRERKRLEVAYALERLDPGWGPRAGARWVDASALDEELAAFLGDGHVPPERAPWAQEGWLAEASAWIESSLGELGRPTTGPVQQVRVWPLSAVLRAPTTAGNVFFKATCASPLFVDEGRVMEGLSRLFPREVPRPLAVDSERRWMLLDDVGPALGWDATPEEREPVLATFARMQVASTRHVDELLALGCVDRRLDWLVREVHELLADAEAVAALDEDKVARLRELEPTFASLCRRLDEGPVPDALAHGDLHLANVARNGDGYLFFDWSDAGVTHPFLDLIDIHGEKDAAVRDRLRDAYLAAWSELAPRERLLELWELASPLSSLNQAVSYRHIMRNVEPGSAQGMERALPGFLELVLEADLERLA